MATHTSRRNFLKQASLSSLAVASAPLLSSNALASVASSSSISRELYNQWLVVDGLGAMFDVNLTHEEREALGWKFSERMKRSLVQSGVNCVRYTTGFPFPVYPGDDAFEKSVEYVAAHTQFVYQNSDVLTLARTTDEIMAAKAEGKVAITFAFQNCQVLGKNLDHIDTFRNLGVQTMQLTYNAQNQLGGGANVSGRIPLSKFGHEAVERMNESKVLIDLSHSGERTCLEAIEASKQPVVISHSGCRALADFPRNKTDKEMRALAEKGGVFGIYFMPFLAQDSRAGLSDLIAHIEHAVNVCGEDQVSIGTDGTYVDIEDKDAYQEETDMHTQIRMDSGAAAAGEKIGNKNFIPEIVGQDQFYKLANALAERGHSHVRIEKILGLNAFNAMKRIW